MSRVSHHSIDAFVLQHYKLLTAADMSKECGCDSNTITSVCSRLKIKPISVKQQNEDYIMLMHKRKTLEQLAKCMDIGVDHAEKLCRDLGVTAKPEVKRDTFYSPGAILGAWQHPEVSHYHNQ